MFFAIEIGYRDANGKKSKLRFLRGNHSGYTITQAEAEMNDTVKMMKSKTKNTGGWPFATKVDNYKVDPI